VGNGGIVMSGRHLKLLLLACCGVGALLGATVSANAGGFAVREQSAYGQGSSFAGIAAGGALSSMFWNPATMTQVPGIQFEAGAAGIIPYASHTVGAGSSLAAFGSAGDSADDALVPNFYASWQINPQLWLGLSFNAPFGLSVSFPEPWAGRGFAANTSLKTYNAAPSIAFKINDWISVGAGVQIQYAKADLSTGLGATPGALLNIAGDGWAYGLTAGVTITPTPTTTIGIGYRSALNQKIDGSLTLPAGAPFNPPFSTPGSVNTTLNLPDVVSVGLRQRIGAQLTLLGSVEWANWSRIGTSNVLQSNGSPALVLSGFGGGPVSLPFQYSDGWFYSIGAEYQWNERLMLRAGIGFETSPITDQVRTPRLPDNDRTWLSAGLSYKLTNKLTFDAAYSHLFVKDTSIAINATSGNPWFNPAAPIAYNGTVDAHVDIISVGLKYRFDDPAPAKKMLYTK
jgi:long-chain fatty acid transport protein